jgi:hypothetical protein
MPVARREFLSAVPALPLVSSTYAAQADASVSASVAATFPAHEPYVAREMVSVSHGNVTRVRELLAGRPALANAAWDWGYGDWETALGAASHMGKREIARLLLAAGARPSIFCAAMLGQLDVVEAFVRADPGIQRTRGPHGLTLLHHARAGGAASDRVARFLEKLGDADPQYCNEPLAKDDQVALTGIYAFGSRAADRLTVAFADHGPTIAHQNATPRRLFHLGGRVFHPPGAEAVRILFGSGAPAPTVTIEDGPTVVVASRTTS